MILFFSRHRAQESVFMGVVSYGSIERGGNERMKKKGKGEREGGREGKENRPSCSAHDPTQPQRPPDRSIASQTPPAEDQIEGKRFPGRERREEDESEGGSVVEGLEEDDLR